MEIWTNFVHARFYETPIEEIKYLKQLKDLDDQSPDPYWILGLDYYILLQYNNAIPEFEKYLIIKNKWRSKPQWELDYTNLAYCYQKTGQYDKEHKLLKKAEKDFPDGYMVRTRQASLALIEKDTVAANRYIKKFKTICKNVPMSEAVIATRVAGIYIDGGMNDKAEEYYRRALSFEPENPDRLNYIAYFLIDRDRNITEGMNLVDKVLELNPDNYQYLRTKGWGLYKQGKYKEALSILQRSWDLRINNTIYSYKAFLELEEVKKAVAGQK
jgi:tetratricopeptide (TPR) repeat protein